MIWHCLATWMLHWHILSNIRLRLKRGISWTDQARLTLRNPNNNSNFYEHNNLLGGLVVSTIWKICEPSRWESFPQGSGRLEENHSHINAKNHPVASQLPFKAIAVVATVSISNTTGFRDFRFSPSYMRVSWVIFLQVYGFVAITCSSLVSILSLTGPKLCMIRNYPSATIWKNCVFDIFYTQPPLCFGRKNINVTNQLTNQPTTNPNHPSCRLHKTELLSHFAFPPSTTTT